MKSKITSKIILIFMFVVLVSDVSALYISEIMYDPIGADSGREWIEIYNDGPVCNVSDIRFYENSIAHKLSAINNIDTLEHGQYALIVDDINKFKKDYPYFKGPVLDSSWSSLSNAGETIGLLLDGVMVDELDYLPIAKAGNTLERIGQNDWINATPTPWTRKETTSQIPEFSIPLAILFLLGIAFLSAYRR